jgi:hypothetical protein
MRPRQHWDLHPNGIQETDLMRNVGRPLKQEMRNGDKTTCVLHERRSKNIGITEEKMIRSVHGKRQ